MSLDVVKKIREGKKLSEVEVKYAVDRGIELPKEYSVKVTQMRAEMQFGTPVGGNVAQTGPQFEQPIQPAQPHEPGVFLSADALDGLTKDELAAVAGAAGLEVDTGQKKANLIAQMVGAVPVAEEDEG